MNNIRNGSRGYDNLTMESNGENDGTPSEATQSRPVATTLLFSSTMLSQMNLSSSGSLQPEQSAPFQEQPLLSEAAPSIFQERPTSGASADVTGGAVQAGATKESTTSLASNFKSFAASAVPFQTLKAATNIKTLASFGGEAVNVIADFIPVVGNSGASLHYSRLRSSSRPIDSVNLDELACHPLHKCCALSATAMNSSSTQIGGGDLASIKELVGKDPSLLQEQLPTSRDTPLHIAIRFGAMQWHQMLDYPGGASNLEVIECLIQAEIGLLRKKALRERKEEGTKTAISLESLVVQSALYKQDINKDLPIHIAAAEGYEGAARTLLRVDKDAGFGTLVISGSGGNLPLHLAVLRDDIELTKLLLTADCIRAEQRHPNTAYRRKKPNRPRIQTIFKQNDNGDLPLHLALPSHLKFELYDVLLTPDVDKKTLYVKNTLEMDALHFFLEQPHLCKDESEFVDKHLANAILQRLLSGKRLELWDDHLKRSLAKSRDMQLMMNNAAANRVPCFIFIADFCSHVLSITALFFGTDYYLKNDSKNEAEWLAEVIFAMVAYFSIREIIQLLLSKSLYWTDFWNYVDIARICMLVILAVILQQDLRDEPVDEEYTQFLRRFLLALAVFMYLGFISFLRITYLQFALFVGGIAEILITLIPFGVTFILLLCLFAYGYWVGGFESSYYGEGGTYGEWVIQLFMTSMDGPESLATMEGGYINAVTWTCIFFVLVQILLLNVLIAVITSAWDSITERQNEVFWKYRLEYETGVLPIEHFLRKRFGRTSLYRCFGSIARFIDSLDDKRIVDTVDWNTAPYSNVLRDHSLYWDKTRWQLLMFEELKDRHDTQRMWRVSSEKEDVPVAKIEEAWRQMRSFEADVRFARSGCHRMCIRLKQLGFYTLWVVSFIAGFLSLGFCWPQRLRIFFCAPSTTRIHDEPIVEARADSMMEVTFLDQSEVKVDSEATRDRRYEALEKKMDGMKDTIQTLQQTVEAFVKLQSAQVGPRDGLAG